MTRIYIAGPMSGIPQFNFPAFHAAAHALRLLGFEVVSPAETDPEDVKQKAMASADGAYDPSMSETWGDSLARDVKQLADGILKVMPEQGRDDNGNPVELGVRLPIDSIVFLPGWEKSRGARLEAFVGLLTGKEFGLYDPEAKDVTGVPSSFIQHQLALEWRDAIAMYTPVRR